MKKLLRSALLCAAMWLLAGVLSGCDILRPIDDLYALPGLPDEYSQLQSEIQAVMDEMSAEYASISYGNYTSTIQLLDMDNDGEQETAAVFLRVSSADEKPLQVCLFRRNNNGTYRLSYTVQGDGSTIHSVTYQDITGDGEREMIVSWQMSTNVYMLSAYQFTSGGVMELMNVSYNEYYLTTDLDKDGGTEIVVFQLAGSETETNRAEYYRYQDGVMVMSSVGALSAGIWDVSDARVGKLSDGVDCIYATCSREGGVLTDILVLEESGLRNVTRDASLGVSQTTLRSYAEVGATDINRDGIMEIPMPIQMPGIAPDGSAGYYMIYWCQFNSAGLSTVACASYHSVTDGWYMILPNDWVGEITVSRDDSRSLRGERAVVFYYWPDTEDSQPEAFLTVYRLTGDNRNSRARLPGRVILRSSSSTIYCASLNEQVWECGLEAGDLASRFGLITVEWSSD